MRCAGRSATSERSTHLISWPHDTKSSVLANRRNSPVIKGKNLSGVIFALEARIHKPLTLLENKVPWLKAEDDGKERFNLIATSCGRDIPA